VKRFCPWTLVVLLLAPPAFAQTTASLQTPLTIESAFAEGGITGRGPESIQWSPDNTLSFIQRDDSGDHGELWTLNPASGQRNLLVGEVKLAKLSPPLSRLKDDREREQITRYHVEPYQWTPDSKHLLFNALGQLWFYTIESGTAVLVSSSPEPARDSKFSPNGNKLAYLRKHNLYVRSVSKDLADDAEIQLTRSSEKEAKDESLLNGEVDWVYAEELSVRSNYFWSPDSRDIVFLQMDESRVPAYPVVNWMPTHPTVDMEKYPQAGDPNPVVRLGVVSSSGGKTRWISLTNDSDDYIPRFGWVRDGLLWAQVLNRAQDTLDLYFVDARSGHSRKVLTEAAPGAWVYVNDDFKVLKSGDRFLWSSWRDGTNQLYFYSFDKEKPLASDARLERQLTQGDFEMLGVDGLDESAGLIYFNCNKDDPRQRQLYSVKIDGSGLQRVSREVGTHAVTFAGDGKHYFDEFSALMTPPRLSACDSARGCTQVWSSRNVDGYGLTPPKFLDLKANDGTTLYGELLLPPANGATGKIPLIVNIYGGPAAQLVQNTWIQDWSGSSGLFHQILAREGFAIFTVDNRGTPARNRKFQTAIRHQFGAIELQDQLAALDQLFAQYPRLDRGRVGIWGWSNGGSMTLYAMTHSDVFKAGAAVSPVTSWRNYDSIYTERNNGLPTDKTTTSYTDLDLAKVADKLHGSLLLLHGTSDDNVHFQNSIQMVEALVEAGKQFRFMAYPNKTHSIAGATDQTHLFHLIEDHFVRELK
jgi:dipeptidyl-peptidase-4